MKNENVVYPVAHGEGHYYCTDEIYRELNDNNQIILKYTNNPNGSWRILQEWLIKRETFVG